MIEECVVKLRDENMNNSWARMDQAHILSSKLGCAVDGREPGLGMLARSMCDVAWYAGVLASWLMVVCGVVGTELVINSLQS